eukprot:1349923-Rhodomonas_salina.1
MLHEACTGVYHPLHTPVPEGADACAPTWHERCYRKDVCPHAICLRRVRCRLRTHLVLPTHTSGTEIACGGTRLGGAWARNGWWCAEESGCAGRGKRASGIRVCCYAMWGTALGYAAMQRLCGVRYWAQLDFVFWRT